MEMSMRHSTLLQEIDDGLSRIGRYESDLNGEVSFVEASGIFLEYAGVDLQVAAKEKDLF